MMGTSRLVNTRLQRRTRLSQLLTWREARAAGKNLVATFTGGQTTVLQCLGSVGDIQSKGHPAVGIQIDDVPLFLQGMDRKGTLPESAIAPILFTSVYIEEHAHILVYRW